VSLKTERKLRVFCDEAYLSLDLQQKILTVIRKRQATGPAGELPVQIEGAILLRRAMRCWRKSRPSCGPSAARGPVM